jgi:hypothetical protein
MERLLDGAVLKGLLKGPTCNPLPQSGIDGGSFGSMEEVPALGLGLACELLGFVKRRVHLNGETVAGIKQFDEQRKAGCGITQVRGTENLFPVAVPKLMKGFSLERPFLHHALGLGSIDHFPEFPDLGYLRDRLSQKGFKATPSPDAFHG